MLRLKMQTYRVLEDPSCNTPPARLVRGLIMGLILISTLSIVLDSVDALHKRFADISVLIELLCVGVFTGEYLLRLWSITADPRYAHPVLGRLRYAVTPMALVDLAAILPAYLTSASHLLTLRSLRLVRIFRVFKLARYSTAMRTLGGALASKREEITVVLFVLTLLLVIAASMMYYVENEAQPQAFSSIPAAMWWGVATLTTVGYGDVYPTTPLGKVLGALVAVLGAGLFAMPAAIWGAAFVERLMHKPPARSTCPHCGREITPSKPELPD